MDSLLIVENNEFFRKLLKDFLSRRFPGLSIEEAPDGEKALLRILAHPPRIILMDVQLTGQNGLKLTRQIKNSYPETSILLFSNYDLPELRKIARDNGAERLILKDALMDAGIPEFIETVLSKRPTSTDPAKQPRRTEGKPSTHASYHKLQPQIHRQLSNRNAC